MSENYLHLLYLMGRDPVDHRKVRNRHHQLCGCATKVIQKNNLSIYNKNIQVYCKRKSDFYGK